MAFFLVLSKLRKLSDAASNLLRGLTFPAHYPAPAICSVDGLPFRNGLEEKRPEVDDGFLWAVPHKRVTVERRSWRRIGHPYYNVKKKVNIRTCETCGHFHLQHTICGNCYAKVKEETELMKEAIQNELKLDPVEKEVVVLYRDDSKDDQKIRDKKIVELPRERPPWFSKNLLTKARTPLQKDGE